MLNWPHFTHGLAYEWRRMRKQGTFRLLFKVCSHCGSLILWFLLLPLTIILHLAGYRRVTVFTDRIGHLALEPDCLLKEQALGRIRSRKWLMLAPPGRVANEHLLTYWQSHFHIVRSRAACFLIASMSRLSLMRHDVGHYARAIGKAQAAYRVYAEWGNRPSLLKLTTEDEIWGNEMLAALGLPEDAWFVCVHAREGGYSPIDEELHRHRNSNIENAIPAMLEIVRRGGWVIRTGDPSMRPLPAMRNVVDYAHHKLKSDRLDILLCARTRFFLGNTSGIAFLSSAFGIPCALANMIPIATLGFGAQDISIPKLLWSKPLQRHLRLDELLGSPVANYQYANLYDESGLCVEENSKEDVFALTMEMLGRLDGTFTETQDTWDRPHHIKSLLEEWHYCYGAQANMSSLFLQKHAELLPNRHIPQVFH